ncbi:hypothetical protein PoB_000674500 [Plakobranchus ocellatus]|uniref:Small EDRK-rich factor-like N-terminal domain-containing protein n=1 Tax=Plakobranchus ocellatus TaxID=259542 RepID=A0AAV3YB10_9GAST|nr:hypothetical protein PoB_000674500 [Plakobranchus ocellatus]
MLYYYAISFSSSKIKYLLVRLSKRKKLDREPLGTDKTRIGRQKRAEQNRAEKHGARQMTTDQRRVEQNRSKRRSIGQSRAENYRAQQSQVNSTAQQNNTNQKSTEQSSDA